MSELANKSLTATETRVLLAELLRQALREIFVEHAAPARLTDAQIEARIAELETEIGRLRRDARRGEFQSIEGALRQAAASTSIPLPHVIGPELGRPAMDLVREIRTAQVRIEDGEEPTRVMAPLAAPFSTAPVTSFAKGGIRVSEVTRRTHELYPTPSMRTTIDATDELVREFFGDVDFDLITAEGLTSWVSWLLRLPKTHGKKHGRNRYTSEGRTRLKQEEIEEADFKDELATEEIRAMEGLSVQQKRAKLAEKLVPRMTVATVRKHRNNFARMLRAAENLGFKAQLTIPSYKEIDNCVARLAQGQDELHVRVTKPKVRIPWSKEHLARLLTSPIYTGCASPHRRWKPGSVIIRDAVYWLPLLVMLIGSRIEEILRLKKGSLRLRNGVECLAIGLDCDEQVKTRDSVRFVPIPQVLLDLGFAEWIRGLSGSAEMLLFPEAAARSSKGAISDAFGKHLRLIFSRLGLADFDEDIYALRKTLLSNLSKASVPDGQRKAIAGHRQRDITNLHYTAHESETLKAALDRVEYGLRVEISAVHGFPVITGCELGAVGELLDVTVDLDDAGQAAAIEVRAPSSEAPILSLVVAGRHHGMALSDQSRVLPEAEAAAVYRKVTEGASVRLPRVGSARAAIEHFAAMANPCSGRIGMGTIIVQPQETRVGAEPPRHPAKVREERRSMVSA